jgi:hypothetical protein
VDVVDAAVDVGEHTGEELLILLGELVEPAGSVIDAVRGGAEELW